MRESIHTSWIERHPWLALLFVNIVILLTLDFGLCAFFSALGWYVPYGKTDTFYRTRHDIYHHALRPNMSFDRATWGNLIYQVHTNSLGFKDRTPRRVPLKSDSYRVLVLGDSFVEGIGYSYDDTFFGSMEASLDGKPVEFLNAGVSSYSPIIYWKKTESLFQKGLQVDRVIVFVDISDIVDDGREYSLSPSGKVLSTKEQMFSHSIRDKLKGVRDWFSSHSIFFGELRKIARVLKQKQPRKNVTWKDSLDDERSIWTVDSQVYASFGSKGKEMEEEHMDRLVSLLRERKIPLTIVIYPWPDQIFHHDLDSLQVQMWKSWCEKRKVDFVNFFPSFIGSDPPEEVIQKYFITGDVHWNKNGHELVAEGLKSYLSSKGFEMTG